MVETNLESGGAGTSGTGRTLEGKVAKGREVAGVASTGGDSNSFLIT